MIKVQKLSSLHGAEAFGHCTSCGKGSKEAENYRIIFATEDQSRSSITLCKDCMQLLAVKMQLALVNTDVSPMQTKP